MRAGWINVVVAAIVMLATLPGRTQGLGLITEPMLARPAARSRHLRDDQPLGDADRRGDLPADRPRLRHRRPARHHAGADAPARRGGLGHEPARRRRLDPVPAGPGDARARPERAVRSRASPPSASPSAGTPACRWASTRCCSASSSCWRSSRSAAASAPPAGGRRGPRSRSACVVLAAPAVLFLREPRTADRRGRPRRRDGGDARRGAADAGLLDLRGRDVAVRPGVVGPRPLQPARARRARIPAGDLRDVPGRDRDHRAGRPVRLRLADAAPGRCRACWPSPWASTAPRSARCRWSRRSGSSGSSP